MKESEEGILQKMKRVLAGLEEVKPIGANVAVFLEEAHSRVKAHQNMEDAKAEELRRRRMPRTRGLGGDVCQGRGPSRGIKRDA
jgi:hypothetical protein